jgi:hypothetical protein
VLLVVVLRFKYPYRLVSGNGDERLLNGSWALLPKGGMLAVGKAVLHNALLRS